MLRGEATESKSGTNAVNLTAIQLMKWDFVLLSPQHEPSGLFRPILQHLCKADGAQGGLLVS